MFNDSLLISVDIYGESVIPKSPLTEFLVENLNLRLFETCTGQD